MFFENAHSIRYTWSFWTSFFRQNGWDKGLKLPKLLRVRPFCDVIKRFGRLITWCDGLVLNHIEKGRNRRTTWSENLRPSSILRSRSSHHVIKKNTKKMKKNLIFSAHVIKKSVVFPAAWLRSNYMWLDDFLPIDPHLEGLLYTLKPTKNTSSCIFFKCICAPCFLYHAFFFLFNRIAQKFLTRCNRQIPKANRKYSIVRRECD